jgi:hypothetical protein
MQISLQCMGVDNLWSQMLLYNKSYLKKFRPWNYNCVFYFFAYRNKVALFYTKNRSESSTFCIILFHLLGDDCQSIPTFVFFIFHKSF